MRTTSERVDDIPLLIAELEKSQLSDLLNQYFPDHGNWQGVDSGKATVIFLTYVLSRADHRLSHVEQWTKERLVTLRYCLGLPDLSEKDLTDDKLATLLDRYSDMDRWTEFEQAHNRRLINVYDLATESQAIRLDAMIVQSHREAQGDFQYGHSKQHRSDLPQLKTMVATLDPMAMPLYSLTVPGNTADDGLYWPTIEALINNLPLTQQLFVGDSKMGSLQTRSRIHSRQHYYLVPLSKKQCSPEQLRAYLAKCPEELVVLNTQNKDGTTKVKAKAFEKLEVLTHESTPWMERRVIVFSPAFASRQQKALEDRIIKAQNELALLTQAKQGRKKPKSRQELELMVDQVLTKYRVSGLLDVQINEHITTKQVRSYLGKPERIDKNSSFTLDVKLNQQEQTKQIQLMGWRAYATNASTESLTTQQAIECYRNEYKIEHKFDELLNRITALMPLFVQKPNRIKALICLLLLALKFVSLIQHQVRTELATTKQTLNELYPGNPARATDKPTTNLILSAFNNITLVIVSIENKTYVNLQNLKPIQLKLLGLLKIPPETYLGFNELIFSHFDFGET